MRHIRNMSNIFLSYELPQLSFYIPAFQLIPPTFGSKTGNDERLDYPRRVQRVCRVGHCIYVCDLCFGVRKSMLMKEEVRVSRAVRRTMGKMVTYFSFVCMVCMINVAAGNDYTIDRWACLLVCGIEFLSIISNILKPKGYTLNVKVLVAALLGKAVGGSKEDFRDVIEKENPTKN